MLLPKVAWNELHLFFPTVLCRVTVIAGVCFSYNTQKDVELRYLSLNAARTEQGSSEWKKVKRRSGVQLPEMFELGIMPSSGLAFCCLLFILWRSLKLSEHPMKSGGLIQRTSRNRERYHRSLALSRDGKLKEFGPLSRAQREESRCCRSWETVWKKGEPQEIDRLQQNPWVLVPCVLEYCDDVLWSWKEKNIYICACSRGIFRQRWDAQARKYTF